MFHEVLRIRPVLDRGATAQMERSLNSRFTRVANRFRRGLLRALRGSILGVGIGMITRLIQPLAALEERVKKLMGEGEELSDLAERMGAKPGELKQVQLAGQALGMSPEKFNEMLTAYAEAVEEAKKEITDPERKDPLSKKAAILMNFINDENMLKSFVDFMASLRASDRRSEFEREVFGSKQVGAQRRLIDADLSAVLAGIGAPSAKSLDKGIENLSRNTALSNQLEARNEASTFLDKLSTINPAMIQDLSNRSLEQTRKEIEEQKNFQELQHISNGLKSIEKILEEVMKIVTGLASDLGQILEFFKVAEALGGFRAILNWIRGIKR